MPFHREYWTHMDDADDLNGITEEGEFEEDPFDVVSTCGEKIAEQSWSGGSWSSVYKYKDRYFVLDEVEFSEFEDAREAFQRAGIGRSDYDKISNISVAPAYRHLVSPDKEDAG
jgi:hypothetical protein